MDEEQQSPSEQVAAMYRLRDSRKLIEQLKANWIEARGTATSTEPFDDLIEHHRAEEEEIARRLDILPPRG